MRLEISRRGYTLKLSARDTEAWATKPGAVWPCSQLRGRSIRVDVDENGLVDLKARPFTREEQAHGIPGDELEAIVSDFTRGTDAAGFWPCWQRR